MMSEPALYRGRAAASVLRERAVDPNRAVIGAVIRAMRGEALIRDATQLYRDLFGL